MKKTFAIIVLALVGILAVEVGAQETFFGKNKVRYKNFDWNFIQTRHFDIHFYENAYPVAKFCAMVMESSYVEISEELNYKIQNRIPVFVYNSHNDFQQTNIIPNLLPEGVGGFTESLKKRIVIPFDGSYEEFRHVLHHELVHGVVNDILFGNSFSSMLSRRRLFQLPLWFNEGLAEYSSRHGWDYMSDMFLRDATINGYLRPPMYLYGFLAYRQGQAMIKYIADKYGEDKLGEMIHKGKIHLTMSKTLEATIGIDEEEFWEDFQKEMKRRYWPDIAERKEADETGKQLTHAREDGSYFNEKPVYSPDGDKIAIFTDESDFTEIVLIDAYEGKILKRLVKSSRSGDLESLHSYVSGVSFSPDGKSLVFVAKSQGKEAIFFLNIKSTDIYLKKRFDYYNILSPSWSPDGKKVVFSALEGHKRDLYVYDIESDQARKITDDRFDDREASWLPNSEELIFSSDRPHPDNPVLDREGHPYVRSAGAYLPGDFEYGTYNIFKIDLDSKLIDPVLIGPGPNLFPRVSPDGEKIAFVSTRNGIDNLYVAYLDGSKHFAVTDILTGVRSISWSPDGDRIAYSAFFRGGYDIFVLQDIVPVGEDGVLKPTAFVRGEYNLLGDDDEEEEVVEESEPVAEVSDDEVEAEIVAVVESVGADSTATEEIAVVTDDADTAVEADTTAIEEEADGSEVAAAEETTDSTVVTETGVYEDEFVFVSDEESGKSALERVMTEIPGDSAYMATKLEEPASFDSIPPLLPSGEYKINKYKIKFTPDFVGGGFNYDTFFGVRGQTYFVFSDYLGNHQIYLATDIVNTIDQSYIQAFYFNNKRRTNLGVGLFHSKNYYEDTYDNLFSDRFYGFQAFARRPFSMFGRLELSLSQFFIDRKYHDYPAPYENRNSKVSVLSGAYVFDNVLWGYTAPMNGTRAKVSFDVGKDIFDWESISFYSVGADYRKYWHLGAVSSMAFRVSGGASFGRTPKRYFLGGTTNWIGSRTLDATVYEVENLYFSDVVTPLRGQKYYGLSGDRYALINWELRFPTIQLLAIKYPLPLVLSNVTGAVFVDMGAAWDGSDFKLGSSASGHSRFEDVKTGFGFGIRMNFFGFALLRYDLAWSTDFYQVSDEPTSYFSFGADF